MKKRKSLRQEKALDTVLWFREFDIVDTLDEITAEMSIYTGESTSFCYQLHNRNLTKSSYLTTVK